MKYSSLILRFTLGEVVLSTLLYGAQAAHRFGHVGHWKLAGRDLGAPTATMSSLTAAVTPCLGHNCVAASPHASNVPCEHANDTLIVAGTSNASWAMLCDMDFFAQDIYPFILTGSFEECLQHCDDYNQQGYGDKCLGFVFAPDRVDADNDCYLKSSVNDVVVPSTIHLVGATLVPQASSWSETTKSAGSTIVTPGDPNLAYSSRDPAVVQSKLLGTTTNQPTKQYVSHAPALPFKLSSALLQPGINTDLLTNYPLAGDTGSWTEAALPFKYEIANLSITPRLSRDGGKGGRIGTTDIFYFCDTSTFGVDNGPLGYMNGFVSSSAAVDISDKRSDDALILSDPVGQWQDDVGRLRGWVPMTAGEEAFNIAISGEGFRYAVWPESSFIPLNETHSVIYAPVVYVNVDMQTQQADFTSLGNTLIAVSIDPSFGPHADRLVNQLFVQDEIEWGSLGGVRSWTSSGNGTSDGMLYLFGQVDSGVLVAKVAPAGITDRTAYSYWNGNGWGSTMPTRDSDALMIEQSVMDLDVFYSPFHKTFLMVYLTPYADNTFYMRILRSDGDIYPPYMTNGTEDYVENILSQEWSDQMVMLKVDAPAMGYIYAGGCHLGYYDSDDIANGGNNLLLTWTEHVAKDPDDPSSGYAHKSAKITLAWKEDDPENL